MINSETMQHTQIIVEDQGGASVSNGSISIENGHLTSLRHVISPYLPPPVLHAMKSIDSNPNMEVIGKEPSMAILVTFLLIIIIGQCIKFLSFLTSGNAVEGLEDDEDSPEESVLSQLKIGGNDGNIQKIYDDSVILFGPSYAGKTCLFHTLLSKSEPNPNIQMIQTVMSLKANVSILQRRDLKSDVGDTSQKECIRLVDYPGHITLSSHLPSLLYPTKKSKSVGKIRGLLVIDSTKSVSDAAMILYNTLLTNASLLNEWEKQGSEILQIMVVCNKSDVKGAKNWRRVKIQLRAELDKLKKISSSVSSSTNSALLLDGNATNQADKRQLIGKNIDLDDLSKNGLSNIKVSFLSFSSVNGDGMRELKAFVASGELLLDNASVLSKHKI